MVCTIDQSFVASRVYSSLTHRFPEIHHNYDQDEVITEECSLKVIVTVTAIYHLLIYLTYVYHFAGLVGDYEAARKQSLFFLSNN